ncbi:MAG: alpha/beta fold hydrolase [Deltaproteobacteria bacterium]|nr:alpha/beta fold hydrolase [Deltaproteobacteria bacterium]
MRDIHVCWSHGKESGPWGTKLTAMVEVARSMGFEADSLDYRGMNNADERVKKLITHCKGIDKPLILAGSSMGGYVAARAAGEIKVEGLFLLAPALSWPGFEKPDFVLKTNQVTIVHGWGDTIIPPETSIRFAKAHRATLHIIDGDHRLKENIEELKIYFSFFLETIKASQVHSPGSGR